MIRLVVRCTAILLAASCTLVIIGLFDLFLNWDLFSKQVESLLYGVFFSFIVLAIAGIALTFVLGIYEIVVLMRASLTNTELKHGWSSNSLMRAGAAGLLALTGAILLLGFVNTRVEAHRITQFKALAIEQAEKFVPRIEDHIPTSSHTPAANNELNDALLTLNNLTLFRRATIMIADPNDDEAIFIHEYTGTQGSGRFVRRFAAKNYELAALSAIKGDLSSVEQFNRAPKFRWMQAIPLKQGQSAVLYLIGNNHEDFREY